MPAVIRMIARSVTNVGKCAIWYFVYYLKTKCGKRKKDIPISRIKIIKNILLSVDLNNKDGMEVHK